MFKKISVLLCVVSLGLAMGGKPNDPSGGSSGTGAVGTNTPINVQPYQRVVPIEELTVDQLYDRALADHKSAQSMNYPEQTNRAINDIELFLKKYSNDKRRFELMYYLTQDYSKNNRRTEQKQVIEDFFVKIPVVSENMLLIDAMNIEKLNSYVWSGEAVSANSLYKELLIKYAGINEVLARLHQDMLPVLDNTNNVAGRKSVYQFFHIADNKIYLKNPNNYYFYTYELAVIYYNEGNYKAAEPLFKEVVAQGNIPIFEYYAQSSNAYLNKIQGK